MFRILRREFFRIFALFVATGMTAAGAWLLLHRPMPVEATIVRPRVQSAVDKVLALRAQEIQAEDAVPFGEDNQVNLLILGIDSRKEGEYAHCDAIHMLTIDTDAWTVNVTSVPRGTYAYIPPSENYALQQHEYYLANACFYGGIDYGVDQIERVVGVQADYVATVGFSQTEGILRLFDMPTTESLQWLRHRRSYQIGDPQRSHNQAVFMKDLALKAFDTGVPQPIFYLAYKLIDTDMDYATAKALWDGFTAAHIEDRPDDIVLNMKPHYDTVDMHFDAENAEEQIESLLAKIRPYTSKDDLSDKSIEEVQAELVDYLLEYLDKGESVEEVVDSQIWYQVEKESDREYLHYKYIEAYAQELLPAEQEKAIQLVADYVMEMQTLGQVTWETQGRGLLAEIVK